MGSRGRFTSGQSEGSFHPSPDRRCPGIMWVKHGENQDRRPLAADAAGPHSNIGVEQRRTPLRAFHCPPSGHHFAKPRQQPHASGWEMLKTREGSSVGSSIGSPRTRNLNKEAPLCSSIRTSFEWRVVQCLCDFVTKQPRPRGNRCVPSE